MASSRGNCHGLGFQAPASSQLQPTKRSVDVFECDEISQQKAMGDTNTLQSAVTSSQLDNMKARVKRAFTTSLTSNTTIHIESAPAMPSISFQNAMDDETVTSLEHVITSPFSSVVPTSKIDSDHDAAIFSISNTRDSSGLHTDSFLNKTVTRPDNGSDQPIYKRLKAGDRIQALYKGDGKHYFATIKSVTHKGYSSAKYDVIFEGYTNNVETISWKDIVDVAADDASICSSSVQTSTPTDNFTSAATSTSAVLSDMDKILLARLQSKPRQNWTTQRVSQVMGDQFPDDPCINLTTFHSLHGKWRSEAVSTTQKK